MGKYDSFSDEQLIEIRQEHRKGISQVELARQYGVSPAYVGRIVNTAARLPEPWDEKNKTNRRKVKDAPEVEKGRLEGESRRGNREGSVFWHAKGQCWQGLVKTHLGRRRAVTGASPEEVELKIKALLNGGDTAPPSRKQVENEKARIKRDAAARKARIKSKAKELGIPASRSISTRLRFTILERDNFTCRYCGHKAPDVTLVVDHIYPVHLGGVTALRNLVTACVDCNAGKSGLVLKDAEPMDEVFPLTPSLARYLTYEEAAYVLQMTVEQFERFWEPGRDAVREILEKRWAEVKLQS